MNGEKAQWRAEVRDLKKNRRTILQTHLRWVREQHKAEAAIRREVFRGENAVRRALKKIDRRVGILNGRLS